MRYHGEFFSQPRTRYSKAFLEKRQVYKERGVDLTPKEVLEQDMGVYVINRIEDRNQVGLFTIKDFMQPPDNDF